MSYDRDDHHDDGPAPSGKGEGVAENRVQAMRSRPVDDGGAINHLPTCALLAESSDWAGEIETLGGRRFKRPEALYKAMRNRSFLPDTCIVDLDAVPRSLVKAVDMRVPCPKLWLGGAAANPADVRSFGVYYARARPDELNRALGRLMVVDQSIVLKAGLVDRQLLPLIVADKAYRERLHHYTDDYAAGNLITLHGDDHLELHLVAQTLAVETQRARIWQVRSESSIHSVLRRIAQARRPGSDVSIVLSRDIDVESARELYRSLPPEYSMIKLSARPDNPVNPASFTLPRMTERPADIEAWIVWFACRATIEHGIALANLDDLVHAAVRELGAEPGIGEIRNLCERTVRQYATMMEERAEFMSYQDLVNNYERTILRRALTSHDWNLSATARSLGLAESSLRYKLTKLGVTRNDPSGRGDE